MGNCQNKPARNIEKSGETKDNFQQGRIQRRQVVKQLVENQELIEIQKMQTLQAEQEGDEDLAYFVQKQRQTIREKELQAAEINQLEHDLDEENNQIIGSETISQHLVQTSTPNLQQQKQLFNFSLGVQEKVTDSEFPTSIKSLTSYPERYPQAKQYQWLRPENIRGLDGTQGQLALFKGISPQDIKQGALGDCYLLCSLSALAEHQSQNLISRLFETKTINTQGVYGVWLCIMGEWQLVIVDDFFPCTYNQQPAFSKANGPELWVLLIEKAYAKVYGDYKRIEAGITGNAVRDLTGASYIYLDNKDVEATWNMIVKHDDNNNILTAGSQSDNRGVEFIKDNGVVSGHAYSILDHATVKDNKGQNCRILKLRNPWGSHEWTGRFSDNSDAWRPEDKQRLRVNQSDDGIFWIPIEDYCELYAETTINFVHRYYKYSSKRVKTQGHRYYRIDFSASNPFKGYIAISQKADRFYEDANGNTEYNYSMVRLIVLQRVKNQDGTQSYQYKKANFKSDRDVDVEVNSGAGDYSVLVEVDWSQNYYNEFVISAYSSIPIQFQQEQKITTEQFEQFVDFAILDKPTDVKTDSIYTYRKGQLLFRVKSNLAGYLYFKYINETTTLTLEETAKLGGLQNLQLCKTDENKNPSEFTVTVDPNETQVVKYRIHEAGYGGYGFSISYSFGVGSGQFGC